MQSLQAQYAEIVLDFSQKATLISEPDHLLAEDIKRLFHHYLKAHHNIFQAWEILYYSALAYLLLADKH